MMGTLTVAASQTTSGSTQKYSWMRMSRMSAILRHYELSGMLMRPHLHVIVLGAPWK
jgi:hypothetical protein